MTVWDDALNAAVAQDVTGEQSDWDEALAACDLMALLELVGRARTVKRHADLIRREAKLRASSLIGEGGSVSDGHTLYRYAQGIERTVKDPLELLSWLGGDAVNVIRLDDAVSIERFRELAAVRARDLELDEAAYVADAEQHFFAVTFTPPDLTEMPLDNKRVPKYAATMTPGEIRRK